MSLLWMIVIVLLVLALIGGAYGTGLGWGAYGWSPLGLVLLILLVLWLAGLLR